MPNGIADTTITVLYQPGSMTTAPTRRPIDTYFTDASGYLYLQRTTAPVPGRWGEAQLGARTGILNPFYTMGSGLPQYVNVVRR